MTRSWPRSAPSVCVARGTTRATFWAAMFGAFGCGAGARVTRIADGKVTYGRYVSAGAYEDHLTRAMRKYSASRKPFLDEVAGDGEGERVSALVRAGDFKGARQASASWVEKAPSVGWTRVRGVSLLGRLAADHYAMAGDVKSLHRVAARMRIATSEAAARAVWLGKDGVGKELLARVRAAGPVEAEVAVVDWVIELRSRPDATKVKLPPFVTATLPPGVYALLVAECGHHPGCEREWGNLAPAPPEAEVASLPPFETAPLDR